MDTIIITGVAVAALARRGFEMSSPGDPARDQRTA